MTWSRLYRRRRRSPEPLIMISIRDHDNLLKRIQFKYLSNIDPFCLSHSTAINCQEYWLLLPTRPVSFSTSSCLLSSAGFFLKEKLVRTEPNSDWWGNKFLRRQQDFQHNDTSFRCQGWRLKDSAKNQFLGWWQRDLWRVVDKWRVIVAARVHRGA